MSHPKKILFVAAEAAPFIKTGGLADVVGSLPKALAALGHKVRVVLPAYEPIEARAHSASSDLQISDLRLRVPMGSSTIDAGVFTSKLPGSDVEVSFVAERNLLGRPRPYGYWDDPYRFAFFSRAALDLEIAARDFRPDVVHCHDWHAAMALAWLATSGQYDERYRNIPSVYTIHNLMHQGQSSRNLLSYMGIDAPPLFEESPFSVNCMARGLYHATMITTVSPTYAREILTSAGGFGLDGLLRHRSGDVHGVLNGLDYEIWNPGRDRHLAQTFSEDTLERRSENRRALRQRLGLPQREDVPLVAMITRLDGQKGLDITGHVIHLLLNAYAGEAQFVVIGSGAPHHENMFRQLAGYHREKMVAVLEFASDLAPLLYGSADLFLMPSQFEPCGLGQMIAMRYGCVPVVRGVGGLYDTVRDGVTGFVFGPYTADAFWEAVQRALHVFHTDHKRWVEIQKQGMRADFSWQTSARAYEQIYEWAVARVRGY